LENGEISLAEAQSLIARYEAELAIIVDKLAIQQALAAKNKALLDAALG